MRIHLIGDLVIHYIFKLLDQVPLLDQRRQVLEQLRHPL